MIQSENGSFFILPHLLTLHTEKLERGLGLVWFCLEDKIYELI